VPSADNKIPETKYNVILNIRLSKIIN